MNLKCLVKFWTLSLTTIILALLYFIMGLFEKSDLSLFTVTCQQSGCHDDISSSDQTNVLLVSYFRSGSSITAEIIEKSENIFYVYEPFIDMLRNHIYNGDSVCDMMDGNCRKPLTLFEQSFFAIEQLADFFNCNTDKLVPSFFAVAGRSEQLKLIQGCTEQYSYEVCKNMMDSACLNSVKLVKTIRFSLHVLEPLLHKVNTLKLIYLTRDPRAIINSRLHSPFLDNITIDNAAHAICDRYRNDSDVFSKLKMQFPGRITKISYEDLIKSPFDVVQDIYNFLNITYTNATTEWINTAMLSGKSSGYYGTLRPNGTVTAYRWRDTLSRENITAIDNICSDLYQEMSLS